MGERILSEEERLEAFCYLYLIKHLTHPFSKMHREWMSYIREDRGAISAPRNFAKSSIFSFFYPLFKSLEVPNSTIVLISATQSLAELFLAKIKTELETNPLLKADYGDQIGPKWTNSQIVMRNGSKILAVGAGGTIRGHRANIVVMDDVENDENVRSKDQRNILEDWFKEAVIGVLGPKQQLLVVGTLLHEYSLLSSLVNTPRKGWKAGKYKALDLEGLTPKSNWEERWPTAELLKRRDEIGESAFEQEYQSNPMPEDWRKFTPDHIKYYKELPKYITFTTTVDPAATQGERSDYTAIVTVGTDTDGVSYVAEVVQDKLNPSEIIEEIFRVYQRWNPHTIGIEVVGFQKMLKHYFDLECKKRNVYPYVRELKLDVSEKGRNKRFRIEALEPYVKSGRMQFAEHMKEGIVEELLSFPTGKHDDMIDALASQIELLEKAKGPKEPEVPKDSFLGNILQKKRVNSIDKKIRPWQMRHRGW